MIHVYAEPSSTDRLVRALQGFQAFRTKFRNDLPREVLGWTKQRIRTRIITEKRGPDGESWPEREDPDAEGSALYVSRRLVNSFKTVFASGVGQLGTASPYAAIHHFGGLAGPRDRRVYIPARPYFGVGKDDVTRLESVIQSWVDRNPPA